MLINFVNRRKGSTGIYIIEDSVSCIQTDLKIGIFWSVTEFFFPDRNSGKVFENTLKFRKN